MARIVHATDPFWLGGDNEIERERIARCHRSWSYLYALGLIPPSRDKFDRDGRSIGGVRDCKFIKDVLDAALAQCDSSDDWIIWTNNDSYLPVDCLDFIGKVTGWSRRRDHMRRLRGFVTVDYNNRVGHYSDGVDLFCFKASDYLKARPLIPDLLMGSEAFDWQIKFTLRDMGFSELAGGRCLVGHEIHGVTSWMAHRTSDPQNLWNRELCKRWALARPDYASLIKEWPTLEQYEPIVGSSHD